MLFIITICLDAGHFLPIQLATFNRLKLPWHWIICEGQAKNVNCTSWAAEMSPRLSGDRSHDWLLEVSRNHPNVTHIPKDMWEGGKLQMFNAAVSVIHGMASQNKGQTPVVLECDADELWQPEQLTKIYEFFLNCPSYNAMQFKCRYFLGPDIVVTSDNCYGNHSTEWLRAWRYHRDFSFLRHEPPVVKEARGKLFDRAQTAKMGLVFDHQAYFYESQVAYKEKFYKYPNALAQWRSLQRNTSWPVDASNFLKWVPAGCIVDKLHK